MAQFHPPQSAMVLGATQPQHHQHQQQPYGLSATTGILSINENAVVPLNEAPFCQDTSTRDTSEEDIWMRCPCDTCAALESSTKTAAAPTSTAPHSMSTFNANVQQHEMMEVDEVPGNLESNAQGQGQQRETDNIQTQQAEVEGQRQQQSTDNAQGTADIVNAGETHVPAPAPTSSSNTAPVSTSATQRSMSMSISSADAQPEAEDDQALGSREPKTQGQQLKTKNGESTSDLESYMPVGVLRKHIAANTAEESEFPESAITRLEKHSWIRTSTLSYANHPQWSYIRVFVLPDDTGRKIIPRSSTALRRELKLVMAKVDRSPEAWNGKFPVDDNGTGTNDQPEEAEDESLWYIFNTLQEPVPQLETMKEPYARQAMEELASVVPGGDEGCISGHEYSSVVGLKTALYPYQRRSAAMMVQREAQPAQMLDPRLQACKSPLGYEYFYDKEEGSIVRDKRMYSEACGGILAETMGCGKTLICLAVILATRGHFPRIPQQYQELDCPVREKTATLVEMAAAVAGRLSLPWGKHFDSLKTEGLHYDKCVKACNESRGRYTIPPPPTRYGGRTGVSYPRPPPQHLLLGSGTLIIAPPNLVDHWEREIAKHTQGLKVLVIRNTFDETPEPDTLLQYDIILFSRIRLQKEAGDAVNNRRVSMPSEVSPLTKIHWLRMIVDEGHNVAGHGQQTNMIRLLDQLHVERRWVVSGTPSSGLYGVEVSLASQETLASDTDLSRATNTALGGRKKTGSAVEHELKDLDNLRHIVVGFLDLKPWSNSRADDPANWTTYIKPIGEDGKRRKAPSLRATLQSLVVRHRMDSIHAEKPLPPLFNKVVHLEPTYHDRLSLNLFMFTLAVNAIASERTGQDYMFHPDNRKHLSTTISNLRQAGFWWTGFDKKDISATEENAVNYMQKNRDRMSESDIAKLEEGLRIARMANSCPSWNVFRQFQELGVLVQDFPENARHLWALHKSPEITERLFLGISQGRQAQRFITSRLTEFDPAEGLAGAGIKTRRELSEREGGPTGPVTSTGKVSGSRTPPNTTPKKPPPNKSFSKGLVKTLPKGSPLARAKLVATASAKLTYLLDQVLDLHQEEKIIIFYDNNNTAFWIAEGLEMIGVDFRIYASTLKTDVRAAYLSLFRECDEIRVLLMDLRQASHGLHIANASRVFIVNPIWQPNVESQAIKRAHRIGQTRPVFVETLVLLGTLEDKMLQRRKQMSEVEIQHAEKDLLDDSTMSRFIEDLPFIPIPKAKKQKIPHMAFLKSCPGFFDRHTLPIPDDYEETQASNQNTSGFSNSHYFREMSPFAPPPQQSQLQPRPSPSPAKTPTKRKRVDMTIDPDKNANASPTQEEPDLLTPKRRRSSTVEYIDDNGIVMTTPSPAPSPLPRASSLPRTVGFKLE